MKKSVTVKASKEAVRKAIVGYRNSEPSKRKVISSNGEKVTIEERFGGVPVVGASRVVYAEYESSPDRIDYKLVESDKVSKFEGSWVLHEGTDGKTVVELTAEIDSHLPIPFKKSILNAQADADMKKRLDYVKRTSEGSR